MVVCFLCIAGNASVGENQKWEWPRYFVETVEVGVYMGKYCLMMMLGCGSVTNVLRSTVNAASGAMVGFVAGGSTGAAIGGGAGLLSWLWW